MPGMDNTLIDQIDFHKSIKRIQSDIKSDFIYAPHLFSIYKYAPDFLISKVKQELKNGSFNFSLPQMIDVPKASGLTRPGAILLPKDRLLYQVLSDNMIDEIEKNLDREHVFSNIPSNDENMFLPLGDSFKLFEKTIQEKCSRYRYCLRTGMLLLFLKLFINTF